MNKPNDTNNIVTNDQNNQIIDPFTNQPESNCEDQLGSNYENQLGSSTCEVDTKKPIGQYSESVRILIADMQSKDEVEI